MHEHDRRLRGAPARGACRAAGWYRDSGGAGRPRPGGLPGIGHRQAGAGRSGDAIGGASTASVRAGPGSAHAGAAAGNPPGTWRLAFNGTFTGRALGTAGWSTGWLAQGITPPVSQPELECYDPANVTVSGGALHLSLIRQPHFCGGRARPYTSGMINTDGKFQFTYGFMQARIWLPGHAGQIVNWPAFWADGQNWPKDGEIDVLEGLGGKACWHFHQPRRRARQLRGRDVRQRLAHLRRRLGARLDHLLLRRPAVGRSSPGLRTRRCT